MSTSGLSLRRLTVAAAACSALFAVTVPSATAAPDTDGQGFVDSTARCPTVAATVAFGSTKSSRVAICRTSTGGYEYRGVRVRDGARLIVGARQSDGGGFVAENDGVTYTLTESSLVVSAGTQVIREESMVLFREPGAPAAPAGTTPPPAPPAPPAPPPAPLPPPLAAEVGGG